MIQQSVKHPNLFEVNTRVLLSRYNKAGRRATLRDVPDAYWQDLADRGMDWVWLMGVWTLKEKQINPDLIPGQMMDAFRNLVPGISEEDIDGSTYAIDDYVVDPVIGGNPELIELRGRLSKLGIRLMLDFIPNHFGAHTHFLHSHPEYFIEVDNATFLTNQSTFYNPISIDNSYYAHGKDPYFDAWQDTIQINYSLAHTRRWMTSQLMQVAALCDGVRCDMAMLVIKRVFEKTWADVAHWVGDEFWPEAIKQIKSAFPEFILMAEVYWDLEAELLKAGFDFCYDKTFYDRLARPELLSAHYKAEKWYLEHTARFLENHDEDRIASRLDLRQHMAAAALVVFGPGLRFWHMGQWEGRTKRIPVQITCEPVEYCSCLLRSAEQNSCTCIQTFYRQLFDIANDDIFKFGAWNTIQINGDSDSGLFLWKWNDEGRERIVAINYSQEDIQLKIDDTELSSKQFSTLIFPAQADLHNPFNFRGWDVRIWGSKNN